MRNQKKVSLRDGTGSGWPSLVAELEDCNTVTVRAEIGVDGPVGPVETCGPVDTVGPVDMVGPVDTVGSVSVGTVGTRDFSFEPVRAEEDFTLANFFFGAVWGAPIVFLFLVPEPCTHTTI